MIDLEPAKASSHRLEYVFVDSQSGEIHSRSEQVWYPLLNRVPLWATVQERLDSPDRVFVGRDFQTLVAKESTEESAVVPRQEGLVLLREGLTRQQQLDESYFKFPPASCECEHPKKYAIVLANDKRSEDFFVDAGSQIGGFFTRASTEDRIRNGGNVFKDFLAQSGFEVTTVIGKVSFTLDDLGRAFTAVRRKLRPCDILFVYVTAHGSDVGAGGFGYEIYRDLFASMPTNAKYLVLDACYAGNLIDRMNEGARVVSRTPTGINGFALTASDADTAANALFDATTFDAQGRRPLSSSNAFLTCMAAGTPFLDLPTCASDLDDLVADNNPLSAAFLTPDSDADGVPDDLEIAFGLDRQNNDTDGDGVCDGIEVAFSPFGNGGNSLIKTIRLTQTTPPSASVNSPFSFRFRTIDEVGLEDFDDGLTDPSLERLLFNDRPVAIDNPYGYGHRSGFSLKSGILPPGLRLEQNGTLSGTPLEKGEFVFAVNYLDPMGRLADFTVTLVVVGSTQPVALIQVTTHLDGNIRDNDISIREAVMLANGTLPLGSLRVDPDPSDRVAEGEVRWVSGNPGEDSTEIDFRTSQDFVINSPIVVTANDLTIKSYFEVLRGGEGPVLEFRGRNANMSNIISVEVQSGPGLVIGGEGNQIGSPRNHVSRPVFFVRGGGSGSGIIVTGRGNVVGGAIIDGFERGLHLTDGASSNRLRHFRLVNNEHGLVIDGEAHSNQVLDTFSGYQLDWESRSYEILEQSNRGYGVVIEGGAKNNLLDTCGVAANLQGGVLLAGTGTSGNELVDCYIGEDQSFRLAAQRMASPNQGHGVTIQDGASDNLVREGIIGSNEGHGVLITGQETSGNLIGQWGCRPIGLNNSLDEPSYDAIRVEGGASLNRFAVCITDSPGNGIHITGPGRWN